MSKAAILIMLVLVILLVGIFGVIGYITNIVRFCGCDFEAPWRTEIIRGVGIFVPPLGAVLGFITIEDGPKTK